MKYIKTYESNNIDALNIELIHYSEKIASFNKMRELISKGADVNYQRGNRTPLMNTVIKGFYSGTKLLIDKGANVNAISNKTNYSVFDFAVSQGSYKFETNKNFKKIIDLLINSGADLNIGVDKLDDAKYDDVKEYISNKFPEQYESYLLRKQAVKYNI